MKKSIKIEFDIEFDEVLYKYELIPKTLYKYRDWAIEKHRVLIKNNSIWVPDSSDFNDPFDCNIPVNYDHIRADRKKAEQWLKKILTAQGKSMSPELLDAEVQKRLSEAKHENEEFLKIYSKIILDTSRKNNGVFSLSPINDNLLLWSHYANSHTGFCVGFDSVKLFDSHEFSGGYVDYPSDFPDVSPIEETLSQYKKMVFSKSNHWNYEFEYRLTTLKKTNQLFKLNPEVFTEIIFGAKMSEKDKNEIKEYTKYNLPHVKFFNCIPESRFFKIAIVPE